MLRTVLLLLTSSLLVACGSAEDHAHNSKSDASMDVADQHAEMDHDMSSHGDTMDMPSDELISGRAAATVMSVSEEGDFITLDHERIEEINMGAMRMGFEVAEGVSLEGLAEGDRILFEILASDSDIVLTALCKPASEGEECLDG